MHGGPRDLSGEWRSLIDVLSRRRRSLYRDQLAMDLRRVLISEHRCRTGQWRRSFAPRFRWLRRKVSAMLVALVGVVRPLVLQHSIPRGCSWIYPIKPQLTVPLSQRWPGARSPCPLVSARRKHGLFDVVNQPVIGGSGLNLADSVEQPSRSDRRSSDRGRLSLSLSPRLIQICDCVRGSESLAVSSCAIVPRLVTTARRWAAAYCRAPAPPTDRRTRRRLGTSG